MKTTMGGLAVGVVAMLLAAACGDNGDEAAAADAEDDAADVASDEARDGGSTCLLDADTVGDTVGVEVTPDGFRYGGVSGTVRVRAYVDPDRTEVSRDDPSYSVSWQGCTYAAHDGTQYLVAELTDEDGNPDVAGFDQLLALADGESDEPAPPDVGDEAFFGGDELLVRAGDRTLVLGFMPGYLPDQEDMATLVDVAVAVVDGGDSDIQGVCLTAIDAVPEAWDPVDPAPLLGSGAQGIDGVDHSYDSCSISLLDGAAYLDVRLGDASLYDATAASTPETPEEETPELVDGIGDAAVWMGDRVYVKVGERALTASGLSADDKPTDPKGIRALGAAAADNLTSPP